MTDLLVQYVAQINVDFPTLDIITARLNSDGMVNDVVIVNEDLVFRFAKNDGARGCWCMKRRCWTWSAAMSEHPFLLSCTAPAITCTIALFRGRRSIGIFCCAPMLRFKVGWRKI